MLENRLMSVQAKDVVCRLFPYTFEGKASTWYCSLPQAFITSWNEFQTAFLEKFGEDKTLAILVLEFSCLRMYSKQKVKDFNQRFLMLMNIIHEDSTPIEGVVIEFYTSTLP